MLTALEVAEETVARSSERRYWAIKHHTESHGRRLDFHNRQYLIDIYDDDAQRIAIQKSVQCGISEAMILRALHATAQGISTMYVLPTDEGKNRFVGNRVDKQILRSPFYQALLAQGGGDDSKGIKQFGAGMINFVGSNSPAKFTEVPIDFLIIDEVNFCEPTNLGLAEERLRGSDLKLQAWCSRPTAAGLGIAEIYNRSDRKHWHLRCHACGLRQPLDWFANVILRTGEFAYHVLDPTGLDEGRGVVCRACHAPLDNLGPGEWVPETPGADISGYHISMLFSPTNTPKELLVKYDRGLRNATEMEEFHNGCLGEDYTSAESKVTPELLDACRSGEGWPSRVYGCTMGVDVGKILHVRISFRHEGRRVAAWIGTVENPLELDRLMAEYDVACCVIDAAPELHLARSFAAKHPGRVWLCQYPSAGTIREIQLDHAEMILKVDRTMSLDATFAELRSGRNILPANARDLDGGEFYEQMQASVRVHNALKNRYDWVEGSRSDHHRHADNYDWLATQIVGAGGFGHPPKPKGLPSFQPLQDRQTKKSPSGSWGRRGIAGKTRREIFQPGQGIWKTEAR